MKAPALTKQSTTYKLRTNMNVHVNKHDQGNFFHFHIKSNKRHFMTPWINHWHLKMTVRFHLKIASTQNMSKWISINYQVKQKSESKDRERCSLLFFEIYLQSVKVLHNLSRIIQQKAHSAMISSHNILSNRKQICDSTKQIIMLIRRSLWNEHLIWEDGKFKYNGEKGVM